MILNIETSSRICSVALCEGGDVYFSLVSETEMDHSAKLAPFVDECLGRLKNHDRTLDAVAVSLGPGSYTGLRIGLSLAKGLCFGLNIPLIGVDTLKLLASIGMFSNSDFEEDQVFIPMIDARRMEIYTAVYDNALKALRGPEALILDPDSFSEFGNRRIIAIGDGVAKAREILKVDLDQCIERMPLASDMNVLSEQSFNKKDFLDIAYSTPFYLKNFQATTPKNPFNKKC